MLFKWQVKKSDKFIVRNFLASKGFSASQLHKIKNKDGHVYVDKKERYLNFKMKENSTIVVLFPTEKGSEKIEPIKGNLEIIFEDEFYLIVNKPAGVASLPARGKKTATMANFVKYYLQNNNEESDAVHVVTRLDRDTSGLMIFAKKSFSHSLISNKLHDNNFIKQYIAIVQNNFPELEKGQIELPIGVSNEFYMKRIISENGKYSLTKYQVLDNFQLGSKVKVDLITGRTHQIRVHFSAINHPLFGDKLYAENPTNFIGRQALHCQRVKFLHPITNKFIDVSSDIPDDMKQLIKRLSE